MTSESEEQRKVVIDGLVATAIALADRDSFDATSLTYLRDLAMQMGHHHAQVYRDAAAAITAMPQPPMESAEETEKAREMRTTLGIQSAEQQLSAALVGREWLTQLADQLDGQ